MTTATATKSAATLQREDAQFVADVTGRATEKVRDLYARVYDARAMMDSDPEQAARMLSDALMSLDALATSVGGAAQFARRVVTADYEDRAARNARRAQRRADALARVADRQARACKHGIPALSDGTTGCSKCEGLRYY